MIWTKIKRTIRAGLVSFWRNGYVSLASVLVMTLTLSVISIIIFTGALLNSTLATVKDKVDVNVYFTQDADPNDIALLEKSIGSLPEVASITPISSDDALAEFRQRHQDDQLTLQALDEIGVNPLGASLTIKAKDPTQYDTIVKFLEDQKDNNQAGTSIIDRINYTENKDAIDALNRITAAVTKLGTIILVFFILVSVLITFNTIRLAIYIFREEISVMRLVGASEMYIRGPFVTVGIMYGLFSGLLVLLFLYPVTYWLGPVTGQIGTGLDLFSYYIANIGYFFLIVLGSGIALGVISSFLAVRKYLRA